MVSEERAFLEAIAANPGEDAHRAAYADWLEEHEDERGAFLHLELQLLDMDPDRVERPALEQRYSVLRKRFAAEWLAGIERPAAEPDTCFQGSAKEPRFHTEIQDTECDAWKRMQDGIEDAAASGRAELAIFQVVPEPERSQLVTLPSSIGKLTSLKELILGVTKISRLPVEIGELTGLRILDSYMLYTLHWYPYELTRCARPLQTTMSTRALYGNPKSRPPFPSLAPPPAITAPPGATRNCSVCDQPFFDLRLHRVWISRRTATADVLPYLVNACSEECIQRLPAPTEGFVSYPHRGGADLVQPPEGWRPPDPRREAVRKRADDERAAFEKRQRASGARPRSLRDDIADVARWLENRPAKSADDHAGGFLNSEDLFDAVPTLGQQVLDVDALLAPMWNAGKPAQSSTPAEPAAGDSGEGDRRPTSATDEDDSGEK